MDPADKWKAKKRRREENKAKKNTPGSPVHMPAYDTSRVYDLITVMASYATAARVTKGHGREGLMSNLFPAILATFRKKLDFVSSRAVRRSLDTHPADRVFTFEVRLPVKPLYTPSGLVTPVTKLYHGMGIADLSMLLIDGQFKPSPIGLLGAGIYVGEASKAVNFIKGAYTSEVPGSAGLLGALIRCEVMLGNVSTKRGMGVDTIHGKAGVTPTWRGTLSLDEYCLQAQSQVRIYQVHIYTSTLFTFTV